MTVLENLKNSPSFAVRRTVLFTVMAAMAMVQLPANAQEKFPSRPITLVAPFASGGSVDIIARVYSEALSKVLGAPIVVENRPGAGGAIGSALVARANADGYTLLITSQSSHLANPLTQPKLSYDPIKDFDSITILGRQPNVLVVPATSPIKDFKQLIGYAKEHPSDLNYASGGVGSMGQLNTELLQLSTGIKTTHVPYRGGTGIVTAVIANEVQFAFDNLAPYLPFILSGKLRALAVAAPSRISQIPDVPTLEEMGYPELNLTSWTGIAAPANTPPEVINSLYQAVREVSSSPEMMEKLSQQGVMPPEALPPADFEKMMSDRLLSYGDVVKRANISAQQ